jgi:hypothetical protein
MLKLETIYIYYGSRLISIYVRQTVMCRRTRSSYAPYLLTFPIGKIKHNYSRFVVVPLTYPQVDQTVMLTKCEVAEFG